MEAGQVNKPFWDLRIEYTPDTIKLPMKIRDLPPLKAPLQAELAELLSPASAAKHGEVLAFEFYVEFNMTRVVFDAEVGVILAHERSDFGMRSSLLRYCRSLWQDYAVVALKLLSGIERIRVLDDALRKKADLLLPRATENFRYSIVVTAAGVVAIPHITQVRGHDKLRPEDEVLLFAFEGISNHARLELTRDLGKIACRSSPFLLAYEMVEEGFADCAA